MEFSVGIDIEKTSRFKAPKAKTNFLKFMFSDKEIAICRKKKASHVAFAGKFCVKEAVVKALKGNVNIRNIEVLNSLTGEPEIYISGQKRSDIKCSVSHTKDTAIAVVIIDPTDFQVFN
jgi:phosphopantetheine--protein transferase-like protein